jgi:hypothetical protein
VGPLQLAVSSLATLVVYSLLLFAAFKIVQIATELGEIKELLKDIKRNGEDHSPAATTAGSPESLMRAVAAATYPPPDFPELPPGSSFGNPEIPVGSTEHKL